VVSICKFLGRNSPSESFDFYWSAMFVTAADEYDILTLETKIPRVDVS